MQTKLLIAAAVAAAAVSAAGARDLVVTVPYGFTTMDPWNSSDTLSQSVARSFYEGLFTFNEKMEVVPSLAESWEVDPSGLVYTVRLKKGVKFSSGEPFNAQAVKLNFDRVLNPENHLTRYGLYKTIKKVDVVDDLTVKFTLVSPFSAFINQLAHPSDAIMCPSLLSKTGTEGPSMNACGTGPYVMERYSPSEGLTVKKNPNYRTAGIPKFDSITFRPTPEDSTRTAMLKTGEAQMTTLLSPTHAAQLQGTPGVVVEHHPGVASRQIYINVHKKPFDDVRVRRALNYAINRKALCKVVYHGFAVPMKGASPMTVKYAVDLGGWPYDPKKARELLKEAGYPNGFETDLWSGTNDSTAQKMLQFLQQQLAQVGVRAHVRALETGQRAALIQQVKGPEDSKMKLAAWGWSTSTGEMDWMLRPLLATSSWTPKLSNYGFYSNPEVDRLLEEALRTTDEKKKAEIYAQTQKILWEDAPWVYLIEDENVWGRSEHLKNFHVLPDGGLSFTEAYWE